MSKSRRRFRRAFARTAATAAVAGAAALFPAPAAHADLVAYWDFDNPASATLVDRSPNGFNATISGGAVYTPSAGGKSGQAGDYALSFDGVNDVAATTASLLSNRARFTVAGWVRYDTAPTGTSGIWGQNNVVEVGFNPTTALNFWTHSGSSTGFATPAAGTGWHHLVTMGTGTALVMYWDGVEIKTTPAVTANYGSSTDKFKMGGQVWNATGGHFQGSLDDVAVWNDALTAAQVASLANGSATPLSVPEPAAVTLVATGALLLTTRRRPRESQGATV
ncbi:MAG TPA: LamG domain-containing protein [Tepidisphaeraceae bacterium]|nr:LamG domain-containing protein [Tepidisphaeraceae bacterium]